MRSFVDIKGKLADTVVVVSAPCADKLPVVRITGEATRVVMKTIIANEGPLVLFRLHESQSMPSVSITGTVELRIRYAPAKPATEPQKLPAVDGTTVKKGPDVMRSLMVAEISGSKRKAQDDDCRPTKRSKTE